MKSQVTDVLISSSAIDPFLVGFANVVWQLPEYMETNRAIEYALAEWADLHEKDFGPLFPKLDHKDTPPLDKGARLHFWQADFVSVWEEQSVHMKKVKAYELFLDYQEADFKAREKAGKDDQKQRVPAGFAQAVLRMVEIAPLLRVCQNKAQCQHPYFIAHREDQAYCSKQCSLAGRRESKRQWWEREGKQWLATSDAPTAQQRRSKAQKKGKQHGKAKKA